MCWQEVIVEEKRANKNENIPHYSKADKNACHGVSFLVYNPPPPPVQEPTNV